MKDLKCEIFDNDRKYHGYIKAHLTFDVPDDMLTMLGKMLGKAWEQWQDDIILHEKLESKR